MFANAFYQLTLSSTHLEFLYGGQRSALDAVPQELSSLFLRQGLLLAGNLSSRMGQLASKSRDPCVLTSSALAFVKCAFWQLNSGPHSCLARTSLTKLFLHSKTWLKNQKKKKWGIVEYFYIGNVTLALFSHSISETDLKLSSWRTSYHTPSLKFNLSHQETKCFIFLIKRFLQLHEKVTFNKLLT